MSQSSTYSLRTARVSDLPLFRSIDDSADALFEAYGIVFEFESSHPFVLAEHVRFHQAVIDRSAWVVCHLDEPVGFVCVGRIDGAPYLDQLSVHLDHHRRGLGTMLLRNAILRCQIDKSRPLWLTTYRHVPWNAPYYAKHGFVEVDESELGPELVAVLAKQRAVLPAPDQRIAMRIQSSNPLCW